MKFSYTNIKKDLFFFHFNSLKYVKSNKMITLILLFIFSLYFFWNGFNGSKSQNLEVRIMTGLIFGIGAFVALFLFMKIIMLIQVFFMLNTEKFKKFLCNHDFDFTDKEIVEKTQFDEANIKYSVIDKILVLRKYILIFIGPIQAYIIPLYRLNDETKNELKEKISQIVKDYNIKLKGKL